MSKFKSHFDLFSFSDFEQEIFPYLAVYMRNIANFRSEVESSEEKILRFALVGLMIDFFATIHQGEEFTSDSDLWTVIDNKSKIVEKLEVLNQILGKKIGNSSEYIQMIFEGDSLDVDGDDLVKFVLDGIKIPESRSW